MTFWMKVDKGLIDSIRFRRVVRKLRASNALRSVTDGDDALDTTIVLGAMVRFWAYADTHIDDDDTLGMTLDEINELVGIDGFAQALPADWLKVVDADHVQLPDFVEHNGSSEKQRRDNARRQAEYRHRKQSHNVTRDVTAGNARNDARTEEIRTEEIRTEEKEETHTPRAKLSPVDEAEHHVMFERCRKAYPPFAGRQNWIQAEGWCRVRIDEGCTWNQLVDAVKRYAAYVKAGGVSDTSKVMSPQTFFGAPDDPWKQPWTLPEKIAKPAVAGWRPDPNDDPPIEVAGHA